LNDNKPATITVACLWCDEPTIDIANCCCDRCLHLSLRIARDLPLAKRMIASIEYENGKEKRDERQGKRSSGTD
jgi:hypothetical protein